MPTFYWQFNFICVSWGFMVSPSFLLYFDTYLQGISPFSKMAFPLLHLFLHTPRCFLFSKIYWSDSAKWASQLTAAVKKRSEVNWFWFRASGFQPEITGPCHFQPVTRQDTRARSMWQTKCASRTKREEGLGLNVSLRAPPNTLTSS